jgi:hypothetical protein
MVGRNEINLLSKFFLGEDKNKKNETKKDNYEYLYNNETEIKKDNLNGSCNESENDSCNESENDFYNDNKSDDSYKKYSFLEDDNNPLSRTFGDFNNVENKYKLHLCIYKINIECEIPFLEYLLDITDIPQFINIIDFQCPTFTDNEDINTYFMNQCLMKLLDNFNINNEFGVKLFDEMYKGFVEYDDNNIFIIFECKFDSNAKNTSWFILDEILFQEKQIKPIILSFFDEYDFMTQIYTENIIFPLPSLMYSYNENNSIIDKTMSISWLGDHHYFTTEELSFTKQRYAVYTDKAKYILRDISEITEEQVKHYMTKNNHQEVTAIYFHSDKNQVWCIKSKKKFTRI